MNVKSVPTSGHRMPTTTVGNHSNYIKGKGNPCASPADEWGTQPSTPAALVLAACSAHTLTIVQLLLGSTTAGTCRQPTPHVTDGQFSAFAATSAFLLHCLSSGLQGGRCGPLPLRRRVLIHFMWPRVRGRPSPHRWCSASPATPAPVRPASAPAQHDHDALVMQRKLSSSSEEGFGACGDAGTCPTSICTCAT